MAEPGLRERKKAQTRQRIADVAAALFAERGYDAVTMLEVARAADVSDQTVYNYFPAKQDLVFDRAEQFRDLYDQAVRGRTASPAEALEPLVLADIDRYQAADLALAKGEFLALCVASPVLRRFALEERERQTRTIAAAIAATTQGLPAVLAHAHAAALVAVVQVIHDEIGTNILDGAEQRRSAGPLRTTARIAFTGLGRTFDDLVGSATQH
jgi:AcrR family transcriptional regulator